MTDILQDHQKLGKKLCQFDDYESMLLQLEANGRKNEKVIRNWCKTKVSVVEKHNNTSKHINKKLKVKC